MVQLFHQYVEKKIERELTHNDLTIFRSPLSLHPSHAQLNFLPQNRYGACHTIFADNPFFPIPLNKKVLFQSTFGY